MKYRKIFAKFVGKSLNITSMNNIKWKIAALLLGSAFAASAQVQNYALQFEASPQAVANLGSVSSLTDASDYTLQLWFNPQEWKQGASLLRCGTFSIKLGADHALVINDGVNHLTLTSSAVSLGKWAQLTLRSGATGTTATINNAQSFTCDTPIKLPAKEKSIWLGGDFSGRIDEVRLWQGSLPTDYNSYWQNTLNELIPSYSSLLAYWKMDQEQCDNVVDYRGSAHGTLAPAGVSKVAVNDNEAFKYRVNLAYGNVQRFFDRKIDARHYSLSNRIAIIGAKLDTSTGAVVLHNPRYDAQMGSAKHLENYNGRQGVADISNGGITVPATVLAGASTYTVEAWIYVNELTGATSIFEKGDNFKLEADNAGQMTLTLNGETKSVQNIAMSAWTHVAIVADGTSTVKVYVGDNVKELQFTSAALSSTAPFSVARIQGAIDDLMFWNSARSASDIAADATRMPLADADHSVAGSLVWNMVAAYDFESADEPGFDRFSVQNWFRTMRSYTEGMRGVRYFLTVNAESFDNCLANATKRNKVIADMSALAEIEEFDGIDIDFEWPNNGWGNIATVVEGVRANLPAGKMITVSPHQVYYNYPVNRIDAVDGFNFQNYGPNNKNLFTRNGFQTGVTNFINQGYPLDKIIVSYATTTSGGMSEGGQRVANTNPAFYPAGYRGIYKEGETLPSDDRIASAAGDCYYFLTGFDQTVFRAQYVVDNNLGGIFYWDLGNDLAATHTASLARAASYVINSNVEKLITSVSSAAPSPAEDPNGPTATTDPEDQGGFDPALAAEAISAALQTYAHRAGYAANGGEERSELLHQINLAHLGQIDGTTLEAARQKYETTVPAAIQAPVDGKKYYLYGVNSNDQTQRYLHINNSALAATINKPAAFDSSFEWIAETDTDGSFTLCCNGQYITAALTLTTDKSEARHFPLTAGNKHGRVQLILDETNNIQTHYNAQNNPNSGMIVVKNGSGNNDATNPMKWTAQWIFEDVEASETPLLYTINSLHPEQQGGVVYNDNVALTHGLQFYVDPATSNSFTAIQTDWSNAGVNVEHTSQTINVDYKGLSANSLYRFRNGRNGDTTNEFMTMNDAGGFHTAALNEHDASQIFNITPNGSGKWILAVQNTYVGTAATTQGVQVNKSATPGSYYVVYNENNNRYAFDAAKPNGGAWADGSCALSAANAETHAVSSWGTGVNYSWWYGEKVEEFEVEAIGGFAAVCLPFDAATTNEVYIASVVDNKVTLIPTGSTIPAHTPVIVKTTESSVTFSISVPATTAAMATYADNMLKGFYPGDSAPAYALSLQNGEPMFVANASASNNSAVIPAGVATAATLPIVMTTLSEITDINVDINNCKVIYDLQGRRVANPVKGIYIINGKKVIL